MAEKSGGHHAPGYRFSVLVGAVICDGFEGVAEGVAEIEDFAEAGLAFIAAYDMGLDFQRKGDDVRESGGVAAKDGVEVFREMRRVLRRR